MNKTAFDFTEEELIISETSTKIKMVNFDTKASKNFSRNEKMYQISEIKTEKQGKENKRKAKNNHILINFFKVGYLVFLAIKKFKKLLNENLKTKQLIKKKNWLMNWITS